MLIMVGFLLAGGESMSATSVIDTQETTSIDNKKSFDYFIDNNKNGVDDRLENEKSKPVKERTSDSGSSLIKRLLNSTEKSQSHYSDRNTSRQKSEQSKNTGTVKKETPSRQPYRHSSEQKDSGGKSYRTK